MSRPDRPPSSQDRTLDEAVGVLFSMVRESLGWATRALLDQDFDGANRVISGDADIDRHCEELTAAIRERLSEAASDPRVLEDLVSTLQIVPELERSADLAKHIALRSLEGLGGRITPRSRGLIQAASEIALGMWQVAGSAYTKRTRDAGFQLEESDNELDEMCAALVAEGLSHGEDPKVSVDLALIARFYERLGDHAVNLAQRIDAMAAPRRPAGAPIAVPVFGTKAPERARSRWGRLRGRLQAVRMVPRDNQFFDAFEAAAANARDCADELFKLSSSFSDVEDRFQRIRQFERRGDSITVELLRLLDASFVPPFDREDVHALTEELDDVVDEMFAAASLIELVHVDKPLADAVELTELLMTMSDEMVALMHALRTREGARYRLERIEQLEHQGDAIYRRAIARLFSGDYDALEILKWKDIVQALEQSCNAIESVSDVAESILVKES